MRSIFPTTRTTELRRETFGGGSAINWLSKQMTILVVDAEQAFRDSIANLLLACGVETFEMASNIEEAGERISETVFDIIFVDLFMPQMTGARFAQEILKRMPETKIILLIEDEQLPLLDSAEMAKLELPTILKSFVSRDLPLLLSEGHNSVSTDM